ncbi:heptaprenyl diphosphate synthase [Bacillus sp. VT 712]|uniref:Heptaprenyl diphosphate synthase component 2 n=1 Tax=Priestia veravalensis TaxID=1414648 RepID=A0A0V8JQY9_9BACI|nr:MULTISPECIES: heptaprenyl diphosphate synthase component II [Bacillaceae]KSU89507.1 heptaprenyl diphosphate synthase [Priestia veravalensis]KZB92561.1 heptaprenyl diphosphate synthase [Bacillus sp. VT 712]MCG7312055.1 heptaprenyl diphosphate synthase component II [Priestia flexa]SCB80316.1 heptaprenyl diphosphate synthase [Priestia flexa]
MKLKMMYTFLNTDIALIEKELEQRIETKEALITNASLHLLQAGGKRIRPVFVLLAGKFGSYDVNQIKHVAVALELIHMASLVHDDVIDDADMRRGKPTIKAKWDNRIAMYTGDYIFARALETITKIEQVDAHKILSDTMVELTLGEIEQIKDKYDLNQDLRTYLRRIKRKTALLIAASCQLGAIAAGAPESIHKKLFLFGYYVGMSFQITDDILDFTSSEEKLGKPVGSDLLQGNITLPVLYALEDPDFRLKVERLFVADNQTELISEIITYITSSDVIDRSVKVSERYLEKAMMILKELPDNKARKALYQIAKYIGKRKF